ncbi:MAG: hypothetical protein CL600_00325 [Alteromonas sp.]|nr:hypothetical protein [Alteromonas sp.]
MTARSRTPIYGPAWNQLDAPIRLPEILEPDWTFALIDSSKFPSHRSSDLIGRLLCFDFFERSDWSFAFSAS